MSTRTRRRLLAAGAASCLAVGMIAGASAAYSVHDDDNFELDGDATSSEALAGEDWDYVYANRANGCDGAGGPEVCSFTTDEVGASIFTTGGSKDEQEVSSWRHTAGSVPAKDDLLHAFAAQYDDGTLYFGADRYATNGDAQIGFWFFHDAVSLNDDGTFSGTHTAHDDQGTASTADDTNGDILILSNFSNGGSVPNIRVFEWYGVGDVRELGLDNSLCGTVSNDPACAITSSGGQASPWEFIPKSGASGAFGNGAFYEGGVDLASLGFGGDCFSSYLAETRSSTSITATLKDFVLGSLGSCGVTVTTQASTASIPIGANGTAAVWDTATITGTGSVASPNPTGSVAFHLCGASATQITSCTPSTTNLVSTEILAGTTNPATATSDTTNVTAVGFYCWTAVYSGDDNYDSAVDNGVNECFEVTQANPTMTTAQSWVPNDTATIDSDGGGALNGTAHFDLFASADCGVAAGDLAVYDEDVTVLPANGATQTVGTANVGAVDVDDDDVIDGYTATASGNYSWLVGYTSSVATQTSIAATCTEVTQLTIDNDTSD